MTKVYAQLIQNFTNLEKMKQINEKGILYKQNDFNSESCRKLYDQFNQGLIEDFLNSRKQRPYIIENPGIKR